MTDLILLHQNCLSTQHPVFSEALNSQAVFIWDNDYFKKEAYSLKRLVFIYESLLELPVEIYQGSTLEVVEVLIQQHGSKKLWLAETPDAWLKQQLAMLTAKVELCWVPDKPFVELEQKEYTRFFKYWNKAKRQLLNDT